MNNVKESKFIAMESIYSAKNLVEDIKNGKHKGSLSTQLIRNDPINAALQAINEYKKAAEQCAQDFDESLNNDMIENDLAEFLLKKKDNDPEVKTVCDNILTIHKYGSNMLQKLNFKDRDYLSSMPKDILVMIASKSKQLTKFTELSRYFHIILNDPLLWKDLCLNEEPQLFQRYKLDEFGVKEINWKKIYFDEVEGFIDSKHWKGSDILHISPWQNSSMNKTLSVNLKSEKLTARILKKLIKNKFKLDSNISNIQIIKGHIIINAFFKSFVSNSDKSFEFVIITPSNNGFRNFPSEWIIGDIKKTDTSSKKEIIEDKISDSMDYCKCLLF